MVVEGGPASRASRRLPRQFGVELAVWTVLIKAVMTTMTTDIQTGYCTNVHAGVDLATTQKNLLEHAVQVKKLHSPEQPMGVGLWLAAPAASQLLAEGQCEEFAAWLAEVGLVPFTFNGFPYGDFHQPIVKHRVYEPTWSELARRDYTLDLIRIQHALLPAGQEGSISTLPIAWGEPQRSAQESDAMVEHLCHVAEHLAQLEADTGRCLYVCLEPEPGCVLTYSTDIVRLFEEQLLPRCADEAALRRYLRVCHDVCHSAVMFEPQAEVLRRYAAAGIRVGKVQVSSAICLPFDQIPAEERLQAVTQLQQFAEDRYLHQTTVRSATSGQDVFYEDLPAALGEIDQPAGCTDELRVHFHMPIYLESFGHLRTSRSDIMECLTVAREIGDVKHFEVETYAWSVLPAELQTESLADGIAREMDWFATLL